MTEENNQKFFTDEVRGNRRYGYLFQTTSLRKAPLDGLISTVAFVKAADNARKSGRKIDDLEVYNITKSVFFPVHKKYTKEGFNDEYKLKYGVDAYKDWKRLHRALGAATKAFCVDLYGTQDNWKSEYEEFLASDRDND